MEQREGEECPVMSRSVIHSSFTHVVVKSDWLRLLFFCMIVKCEDGLRVSRLRVEWNLRDVYFSSGRRCMNVNKRDTVNYHLSPLLSH